MSELETRYRRLLRVLPAWYRAGREDEMVATFLEARAAERPDLGELDERHGWPGWSEIAAVAGLGIRLRLGGPGGPPRAVAVGGAVRATALLGFVVYAALEVGMLVQLFAYAVRFDFPGTVVWVPGALTAVAAIGVVVALVLGRRGTARLLAVLAVLPTVHAIVESTGGGTAHLATTVAFALPVWLAVAAVFASFHREAPPVARRWLGVLAAGTVAMAAWGVLTAVLYDPAWGSFAFAVVTTPPAVLLAVALVVLARRGLDAGVSLGLGVATLASVPHQWLGQLVVEVAPAGQAVTAALAVIGLALVWRGVRALPPRPVPSQA